MVKTKKKEVQKLGLRPSQKAKAEKLRQKHEAKVASALPSLQENIVDKTEQDVVIDQASDKSQTIEPVATITVKNADGDPDTVAEILIQNKIDYTPKVSVVMPVYNVEPYLRQCLDSVTSQTLKEIEIICVDDGSTDASLDILKEYAEKDNRITVITQKNAGSGKARNNGINNANGEFIAFMDSDDMYPSEKTLEHMYKAAIENDVLICGGSFVVIENGNISDDILKFGKGYLFESSKIIEYKDYQFDCGYWRFIYNREFLKKNQLYFPDYLRGQDPPFFIRTMCVAQRFYAMEEATYVYRISHKAIQWTERKIEDYIKSLYDCLNIAVAYKMEDLCNTIIDNRIDNNTFEYNYKMFWGNTDIQGEVNKLLLLRNKVRFTRYQHKFNKEMTIFLISHSNVVNTVGGATSIFWRFGNFLAHNGYNVVCLCYSQIECIPEHPESVCFINLKTFYRNYDFEKSVNSFINFLNPDLMIFFFPKVYMDANIDEKFAYIPRVLMLHSRPDYYFAKWSVSEKKKFEQLYVNTMAQVLLPSYYDMLPDFAKKYPILVNANPIQQTVHKASFEERKKIIYLSRLDECKGIEFLLLSIKKLNQKYSDWQVDIYGQFMSEEYKNKLLNYVRLLGLDNQVFFRGITKDVLNTLCNYDFCVFPSYFEGFSLGLSEALSVGLPCIGLKGSTGVNEQIIDGYNGFLCDENYDDFAGKIEKLITDKELRYSLSKNAIESTKQYSGEIIGEKWLKFIDTIFGDKIMGKNKLNRPKKNESIFSIQHIYNSYRNNEIAILNYNNISFCKPSQVIISLTSYPGRIKTINQAIETLLNQSMKADKVILWLAPEQFPNKEADLPQELLNLKDKGLTIDWYHDIRSYKKLIPTLKKYPEAVIVTADDDILYPIDWLQKLWNSYVKYPKFINCHRAHYVNFRGKIKPYQSWKFCISNERPSFFNFCTTGGGVLYPPCVFSKEVLNEEVFRKLCPTADDVWFWAMCILNNKKIRTVENNVRYIRVIDEAQEESLWSQNITDNDKQINKVVSHYPEILKKLSIENANNCLKTYLLFPFYLIKTMIMRKKHIKSVISKALNNLTAYRIDMKNVGNENNNIEIHCDNVTVTEAGWLKDTHGIGKLLKGNSMTEIIRLKMVNDGILKFDFRGQDKRDINDKRFPLWIDYKSIKINNEEILLHPITTWHDQPYHYEMPVKDRQEIILEINQQYHEYTENELEDLLIKLRVCANENQMLMDIIIGELKNKFPIISEDDKNNRILEAYTSRILSDLCAYRIDVKNIGHTNNSIEFEVNNTEVIEPKWFTNIQGIGKILQGNTKNSTINLRMINDGILKFDFRGQDKRDINDKRFPLWIDYKSIKIDGKEILSEPVATWHDKPYNYEMLVKDGQEITLEVEQQYHEYTKQELKEVILKLNSKSDYVAENIDNLIKELEKQLPIIDEETFKRRQIENCVSKVLPSLTAYRIDIKNIGTEKNNIEIEADNISISEPKWLTNEQGIGKMLQGNDIINNIKLKIINDGILRIDFRGQDKRYNGTRFPVWIDYKSIKINGKEILSAPVATWHDQPYHYEMPVEDGQEIRVEIEQQYHEYIENELKDLVLKLYPYNFYMKDNINCIMKELKNKLSIICTDYTVSLLNKFPQITADCFIPLGDACRPAYWLRTNHLRYCSLPFDWLDGCSLNFIMKSIKYGISDWFNNYTENPIKNNKRHKFVFDTTNNFRARHIFPLNQSVESYLPEFREIYDKRLQRFKNLLESSKTVCFICNNRKDTIYDFYMFLRKIRKLYDDKLCVLIHIKHNIEKREITEYKFDDNIIIYVVEVCDLNKDSDEKNNPNFWIGNEDLWNEVCSHLSLSDSVKTKLEEENKDKDSAA